MADTRGKHNLEFHVVGDGREFLNFWDWAHGNDVVAEIREDKLFVTGYDPEGNELPEREVNLFEFLKLVRASIQKRTI